MKKLAGRLIGGFAKGFTGAFMVCFGAEMLDDRKKGGVWSRLQAMSNEDWETIAIVAAVGGAVSAPAGYVIDAFRSLRARFEECS
ncbi:MAG TPA: hypothetical protein VMR75_03810 [Candidatus Saccharimonadales bacterium]|nr:hypothetical protein [Candidatus Saccharimonadales bacterium]